MNAVWQVQEAKNRFSELLERAAREGPQTITRHGRAVARVVPVREGEPAAPVPPEDDGFIAFLMSAPKSGLDEGLPPMPRERRAGRKPLFGER